MTGWGTDSVKWKHHAIGAQINQGLGIGSNGELHVQENGELNGYRFR